MDLTNAAGLSYALVLPAKIRAVATSETGGLVNVSSGVTRTVGPAGVDTVFVVLDALDKGDSVQKFDIALVGSSQKVTVSFFKTEEVLIEDEEKEKEEAQKADSTGTSSDSKVSSDSKGSGDSKGSSDSKNVDDDSDDEADFAEPTFRIKLVAPFTFAIVFEESSDKPKTKKFAVMDLMGAVVKQGTVNSAETKVTLPHAGTYIVRVGRGKQLVTFK